MKLGEMNNIEDNKPLGLGYNIIKLETLLKIFVNGYKSTIILRMEWVEESWLESTVCGQ